MKISIQNIIIRHVNLTPKEADSICKIAQNEMDYKQCTKELVLEKLKNIDSKKEAVFVAEYKSNVIGFIHAQVYDVLYFETMVNILGIAVDSKYKRNGIGKILVEKIEEWAKSLNIKLIRLNSGGTRKQAHEFYRNIGFGDEKTQLRFLKEI